MIFGQGQVLDSSQPTNPSSEVATVPTNKAATADVIAIAIVILDIIINTFLLFCTSVPLYHANQILLRARERTEK